MDVEALRDEDHDPEFDAEFYRITGELSKWCDAKGIKNVLILQRPSPNEPDTWHTSVGTNAGRMGVVYLCKKAIEAAMSQTPSDKVNDAER